MKDYLFGKTLSQLVEIVTGFDFPRYTAKQICETFGHIVHGDPVGSQWNLMKLSRDRLGYSVGKVINDPVISCLI